MHVNKSTAFLRALKKYSQKLTRVQGEEVIRRLALFETDWHAPELKTHKLAHAKNRWSFTVLDDADRSDRVIFVFELREKEKEIWLLAIGPHDLVYRTF